MRADPPRRPASAATCALTLGLCALAGCLDAPPPDWLIESPRLLVIEMAVVETGPYSTPLSEDPPGRTRRDGLPGDRVQVRATIVGPEGPITPSASPILVRSAFPVFPGYLGDDLPPCADYEYASATTCRIDGDTVMLPPLPPAGSAVVVYVYLVISRDEGPGSEACFRGLAVRGNQELAGCHMDGFTLDYGPSDKVAALRGEESESTYPNRYNLSTAWIDLALRDEGGERELRADDGDVVMTAPGETITATLAVDADELDGRDFDAVWWATDTAITPAPRAWLEYATSVEIAAPARGHDYWLYARANPWWSSPKDGRLISLHVVTPEAAEP